MLLLLLFIFLLLLELQIIFLLLFPLLLLPFTFPFPFIFLIFLYPMTTHLPNLALLAPLPGILIHPHNIIPILTGTVQVCKPYLSDTCLYTLHLLVIRDEVLNCLLYCILEIFNIMIFMVGV